MKRIVALLMMGIICITFGGCGKDSKKSNKQYKYSAVQHKVIEYNTGKVIVIDDVLYGYGISYNGSGGNREETSMIFRLDVNSDELTEKEIDANVYIENMYAISDEKLLLSGTQILNDKSSSSGGEEDKLYCNVKYVYDADLNQLSKNVSETSDSDDNLDMMTEMIISRVMTKEGKSVSLHTSNYNEFWIEIKDNEGNEQAVIEVEDYAHDLLLLKNGNVLCYYSEYGVPYVYEVDVDKGKLGQQIADFSSYNINQWSAGKGNKMLFATNTDIFECDCNTGKISKLLNLMDCDIDSEEVRSIFCLKDGTLGVILSGDNGVSEIDYLYRQDKNAKKKEEITVGVLYLNSALKGDILRYNKTHDDKRIIVKEYYRDNEENYAEARAEFYSDIVSGNCPDIIDFGPANADINQYIEKGLIEDLIPYIEKDEEISIEDFIPNVVEAYKVDGKLYVLPEAFYIKGFFGAASVVGQESNWTLEEFIDVTEKFEKSAEICGFKTGESILDLLCNYNMSRYIDWSKGECYFDTGEFAKILEFSYDYVKNNENRKNEDDISEITKIRIGQQILFDTDIETCDNYMASKEIFGEDITFKGFPSNKGNGIVINPRSDSSLIAISSKSKYKEDAWEIIRNRYLPKGEFESMNYRIPIRQDDLEIVLNKAMIPNTYIDENGNEKISYGSWTLGDATVTINYPTEEDIKKIKKIINSADTMASGNEVIMEIINEEADAYYKGQKSSDEVAKIIQSRVSLYVKESQ